MTVKTASTDPEARAHSKHDAAEAAAWEARAARGVAGLRLIATIGYRSVPFWKSSVEVIPTYGQRVPGLWRRCWQRIDVPDPGVIARLLRRAPLADAVLLYGGERADLIYLALAGLLPWIRAPHIIIDAHWQPAETPLKRWLQRLCLRMGRRLLADVQIHSPEEIALYERNYGLPRAVLRPMPWSCSLRGYPVSRLQDDANRHGIVSGGMSYRDYGSLFEAVRGESWSLTIGVPPSPVQDEIRALSAGVPNIEIVDDWGSTAFWQRVAQARVFAMPLTPGLQRCTADQTMLTAMALGALTVATDSLSSRIYIRHGVNGFLVPEGDAGAWRTVLTEVMGLDAERERAIREAAQADVRERFSEERRLLDTLERAADAARNWPRGPAASQRNTMRRAIQAALLCGLACILLCTTLILSHR